MEELYGKERADEERLLTYQGLLEGLETVQAEMQHLAPVFRWALSPAFSVNPDVRLWQPRNILGLYRETGTLRLVRRQRIA